MIDLKNRSPEEINKILKDAWTGLIFNDDTLYNPLAVVPKELEETPHLYYSWLISQPEYFSLVCSEFLNVNLLPFQCVILKNMWKYKFPMIVASRGLGKTFLLGVYTILRLLLIPDRQVVVAGSGFRQSKLVYEYCCKIWNNAPLLRDAVSANAGHQGPKGGHDAVYLYIGSSKATFVPVGTGSGIRGLRGDVFVDEFASHSKEIFENVISGFGAVNASPQEQVADEARRLLASNSGIELLDTKRDFDQNQIIISGTAYYYFNHFAEYWKKWSDIINSKGRPEKLEPIFPEGIPEGFNYKDYSVIRMPYDILPHGFMDKANIARSKATLHTGLFNLEFNACETPDTEIITKNGIKKITDIKVGDEVITHKNRFRKVVELTKRPYKGNLIKLNTYGYYKDIKFTPDHPFFKNGEFIELQDVENELEYCTNKELSGITSIDIKNYTYNTREIDNFLYPQSGATLIKDEISNEIIKDRNNGMSYYELVDKYGYKYGTIWGIVKKPNKKTKSSIPRYINLNYDLGLCFGYYASEGSCSRGYACFSLDGHVDVKLEYFIEELSKSIENSFGILSKTYTSKGVSKVVILSRIVRDLFKGICPGICYDKIMEHDILFSNEEFLKGFLVGMINGDGHKREGLITICLANKNLINQIKMAFEYFNIPCSMHIKKAQINIIKGKKHHCKESYKVNLYGKSYDLAMNLLYGSKISLKRKRPKVRIFNENIHYQIKNKEIIEYDGFVYNLEVEEDNSYTLPNCTVHNCFSKDSDGFFKATLIESCVASERNEIEKKDGLINFFPRLSGDHDKRYYMGVDTASQVDNFAIVIIEAHKDHRRIVYCWTTNTKEFKQGRKSGIIAETDFFRYCSGKIRSLMSKFQIERIAIDSQGGGRTIYETLHDKASLKPGEQMIWEAIEPGKIKETDSEEGLHIIEMVNFRKQEYTLNANHGLKKDFEDKVCLFPEYNPAILASYANLEGKFAQEMEDCIENIEELKRELTLIVVTSTATGNERFDTPENKTSGVSETSRNKKDRYSALIMANSAARKDYHDENDYSARSIEQIANNSLERKDAAYIGPAWITERLNGLY
jgi:flavodoxin